MTGNIKVNKIGKHPRMIEIEYVCKWVERKVDQDDGEENIWAKRWTKLGREPQGNQGVREMEFQRETWEYA